MPKLAGRFFIIACMSEKYKKPYCTPEDHVALLKSRGLKIEDEKKTISYLTNIGYFRLSAYFHPLLKVPKEEHIYKPEATFKKVLDMYRFDRKLRLLLFNEIEKIEIAVRSCIVNEGCNFFGDIFWMTNKSNFFNPVRFDTTLELIKTELSNSKEDFIVHFKYKYSNPFPPAWMIAEIIPLGTLCNLYYNIKSMTLRKRVAQKFGLNGDTLKSWLISIGNLRNMCGHHSRLWNRDIAITPSAPPVPRYPWLRDISKVNPQKVYYRICILRYLLFSVSPNYTELKSKLSALMEKYLTVDTAAMGFPTDWEDEPLWKI